MTRTELAKQISFKLDIKFKTALKGIDSCMDDEFNIKENEVPEEMAQDIYDGLKEQYSL
jgi:hypothetical protein